MKEYLLVVGTDAELAGPFHTMEQSESWLRQRVRRGDVIHSVLSIYYNVGVKRPTVSPLSVEYLAYLA